MFNDEEGFKTLTKSETSRLIELIKDLTEAQTSLKQEPRSFDELFLMVFEDGQFKVEQTEEAKKMSSFPLLWQKYLRLQAVIQSILVEAQEDFGEDRID